MKACGSIWERVPEKKGNPCIELGTEICSDGKRRCLIHAMTYKMKRYRKKLLRMKYKC